MTETSASIQDYLKTIYAIALTEGIASTTEIAAHLGIAPASVTGMLQRLSNCQPPLVIYRKHQGAMLTAEGEKAALKVIRHHRLLESYLVTALGYTWDNVHEDACRLEHVISEQLEEKIAAALGNPRRDPHGDPIPSSDLHMPAVMDIPLSNLRPGQFAIIRRVSEDPVSFRSYPTSFLLHVEELGLIPGAKIRAINYSEFDRNLTVQVENQAPVVLGLAITSLIYVEVS
jgi:DtxR family Mn-dependent transcriptional regulator